MDALDDVDILSWLDEEESVKPSRLMPSAHTDTLTAEEVNGTCFEMSREVLLSLLEKAIIVVPSRDMVPVLTNFQFQITEDSLTVVASSLEMSLVLTTNQVTTKVPGTEVFPAKTLLTIVREANAGSSIYIEATPSGAVIVAGGYSAEINMAIGKDFPKMDSLKSTTFHEIDREAFIKALTSVKYALPGKEYSGQDSMKMISIKNGKFTACDGARFHQVRIDGLRLSMQLPTYSITTLLKILSSFDQEIIEIGETKKKLVFKVGNTIFYLNKLDDPYPNVEQLWLRPALSNDQILIVDKQELITAIKQVKVAADLTSPAIGLMLEENSIRVVAKDINNSASSTIACNWSGKSRNIVVNYIHFSEMLRAYEPKECRFLLGEDTKTYKPPILLKDDNTMAVATIAQVLAYRAGLT